MSTNNPDITASDIVTEVEIRLGDTNLDTEDYLNWISHAYQKLYRAIIAAGQQAKEVYFGNSITFNLASGTGEYSLETNIPRFGGIIKVEVKYGGTSDTWVRANRLPSLNNYNQVTANVTTDYHSKSSPLYYLLQDIIGFIPTPPTTDSGTPQAKVLYIKRPYQITLATDVIDIPYRYLEPIYEYVQAKAIQAENESYAESLEIERLFEAKLVQITEQVTDEFGEYEGTDQVQAESGSKLYSNPMRRGL
jgi:hypothetical protein